MLSTSDILTLVLGLAGLFIAILTIVVTIRLHNRRSSQPEVEAQNQIAILQSNARTIRVMFDMGLL
ncbi:hypothetical protein N431DRAFT_433634 [Stipitochalara longipes BDJ]|nr:hypothetical protein N431DRAFT_433634 [Stipitochalara longipes BDJ]